MKNKIIILTVISLFGWHHVFCQQTVSEYEKLKARIAAQQQDYSERYNAADAGDKELIVGQAQDFLFTTICDSLFLHWYNTQWDFNGTTCIPGQGKIACGYFVTTILTDVGFRVPRVQWAQLASETVILKIVTNIKRFHNRPVADIVAYLHQHGDGLYIVGLDCHVGFIYKRGDVIRFVHSSYYRPEIGVMAEIPDSENPLKHSRYRVVGKLLDTTMTENWINGTIYK